MNFRAMNRTLLVILMAVALLGLGLFATGCSNKAAIEDDPTAGQDITPEVEQEPVQEETISPEVPEEPQRPDYANLDPADFGIEDVYFAFDEYDLDGEAMAILSRNARILREAGVTLMISGHCDERGTVDYNMALGEKRALAVRDYLVSLGVPSRTLRTTSYGKSKPFAMGHNEDSWAKNRRAHFEHP